MEASRWPGREEDAETTREARSVNTGHAKRSSSSSSVGSSVKHSGYIAYKKLETLPRCRENVSHTECLSAASQADGMAFYRWKVRVSWRCIYRYFWWVGFSFLPPSRAGRTLVGDGTFFRSKTGVPPSSGRSSSRGPGGRTAPGSCRKPAWSPQEIDVSAEVKTQTFVEDTVLNRQQSINDTHTKLTFLLCYSHQ